MRALPYSFKGYDSDQARSEPQSQKKEGRKKGAEWHSQYIWKNTKKTLQLPYFYADLDEAIGVCLWHLQDKVCTGGRKPYIDVG